MTRRHLIALIFISTASIVLAYASAFLPGGTPVWGAWVMAIATALLLTATMALGAYRSGKGVGRLAWAFLFTFVVLTVAFAFGLAAPAEAPQSTLWLGLPRRAAVIVYGAGVLPMLVLPFVYAATFNERTLTRDDLERIRAAREEMLSRYGSES